MIRTQMLNLKAQYDEIRGEVMASIEEVLASSRYILGPKVEELEKSIARYCGVAHGVGVANGTDALHLSVKSLGIKPGDEVITTPFTFFATVEAIIYEGAIPVFADILPDTFNIDPVQIEQKITPKTKAIMPVHMFGHPADMARIMDIAKRHNLKVIEDCAQSFGASMGGRMTGSFGDAGCFSFYPSKNLGAYGDGGMVVMNDDSVLAEVKKYRNHGSVRTYVHSDVGFNSRLDEIQAAILLIKFKHIDRDNEARRAKAQAYTKLLQDTVKCPPVQAGCVHAFHQYTIRSPKRDALKTRLEEQGVASMIYYPVPMHLQPALERYGYKPGQLPQAELAAQEVLSLPICPALEEAEIARIAEIIKSV